MNVSSKVGVRKAHSEEAHGEGQRHSITAQISRSARRLSAAVVPALTKLDPLPLLQKHTSLCLRIADIAQLLAAVEQYVVHNAVQFSPIDFEITDEKDMLVLRARLHPEEMVLVEGGKKIFSLTFSEPGSEDTMNVLAKIKHPVSGMRVFEFVEQPLTCVVQIWSYLDHYEKYVIEPASSTWLKMLAICGCTFSHDQWQLKKEDKVYATVKPNRALFEENSLRIEWIQEADNELRMLIVAFAMAQMIREAFPPLTHIIREQYHRRQ